MIATAIANDPDPDILSNNRNKTEIGRSTSDQGSEIYVA
jgi:hypothetical protein